MTAADLTGGGFNAIDSIMRQTADFDIHLGAAVRARRETQGMTQAELGKALGVTFQQVQKYERGTNSIAAATLAKIADALDTPASELMGEPNPEFPGSHVVLTAWSAPDADQSTAMLTLVRGLNHR